MNVLKRVCSAVLIVVGVLGCGVSLLAIIDPAGAQLADDGDPFGTPSAIVNSVAILIVYVEISVLGYLMTRPGAVNE